MLATVGLDGRDGSRWILHGPGSAASPARMLTGGVGDLFEAPVTVTLRRAVGVRGAAYLGHAVEERNIVLHLMTFSDVGSTEWARQDAAFRAALAYDEDARLWVQTEESGERWIGVRLAEAPSYDRDVDPHTDATGVWTITLVALDPDWKGQTLHDEVVFTGSNFIDSVQIMNPGNIEVWPEWVLTAPARWALPNPVWDEPVRDLNRLLWFPMQYPGRDVTVDTSSAGEMVTASDEDGSGLWAQMAGSFFTDPIPPRTAATDLPVHIDPVPWLPWVIPDTLRAWIAQAVRDAAVASGIDAFYDKPVAEIAEIITRSIQDATPEILDWLSFDVIDQLIAPLIAKYLAEAYGTTIRPLLGATAQIRIQTRWLRPWGGE